jgi:hypothetical protein
MPTTTRKHSHSLDTPGYIFYNELEVPLFINAEGKPETIDDYKPGEPIYGIKEKVVISKGDFTIADSDYDSFYSTLYLNLILLEYAFGNIFPYHNGKFSAKQLDTLIGAALKNGTITVAQYREYSKTLGFITCLSTVALPAASRKSIIPPADITKIRDKLLAEHKEQLDDPVVVAKIEKQLVDIYKDYIKGDISEGFFLDEKIYSVVLKKSYIMLGSEPKLEDPNKINLSVTSLKEGWQVKDLPMIANSLRMGSYNRGAATALGGEAAKFSSRIYQNTKLIPGDCGSTVGIPVNVNKYNVDSFNGRAMLVNGKPVYLNKGDLAKHLGKTVYMRSPQTCNTPSGDFCEVCMGKEVTEVGLGLGPQASAVGSVFLSQSLAAMHGTSLSLEPIDLENSMD